MSDVASYNRCYDCWGGGKVQAYDHSSWIEERRKTIEVRQRMRDRIRPDWLDLGNIYELTYPVVNAMVKGRRLLCSNADIRIDRVQTTNDENIIQGYQSIAHDRLYCEKLPPCPITDKIFCAGDCQ